MAFTDGTFEPVMWPAQCSCGTEFETPTLFPPAAGTVLDRRCSLCQAALELRLQRQREQRQQQADTPPAPTFARPRRVRTANGSQLHLETRG